jgi:hypothetical protein
MNARIVELLTWSAREGMVLPRPAEEIVALEEAGHVVDLESGDILWDAAEWRYESTVVGEATYHLRQVQDEDGELGL